MVPRPPGASWLDDLTEEDVAFLKRLVLASGSLKDVAAAYGVSYPTIRVRLDRLIEKVRFLDRSRDAGPFERALLKHYADRKIDASTMKALLTAHQREVGTKAAPDAPTARSAKNPG